MSTRPDDEPTPSSSECNDCNDVVDSKDDEEPAFKKRKTAFESDQSEKLEHRLGGILCCAVCLDLPQAAVYQCTNGHLMCAPCFTHLLADARLRDETATCPNCRIEISKISASRNLAVEKTVSELPSECRHCKRVFPRHSLQNHEDKICEDRVTGCRFASIGCRWRGAAHAAGAHETVCAHPRKSAAELLDELAERERRAAENSSVYTELLDLLSNEKITFNDLQLKPCRSDEMHKLYYETSRFSAFGHQWVVKAFINRCQRDPTQSTHREITYLVMLKSKVTSPVSVHWLWTRGPWGEAPLKAEIVSHAFREDEAAPSRVLPLADPADANRLLSARAMHFRLIMFLATKSSS